MRPKRPASGVKPEEPAPKKQKGFEEVGAALKMLERPILKRDPKDEHQELVDAMNIWKEEAELGEEIQKRHAAKPKAQGRWNRKDRAEDEAELLRAAKAARVEVMEKEEEEEYDDVEKEKDGLEDEQQGGEDEQQGGEGGEGGDGGEGHEEEGQEHDDEVNPDDMDQGGQQDDQHEQDEMEDGGNDGKQKQWWGHHGQGWWKRSWHKGKGKHYDAWQPRRKPHWASWKPHQKNLSGKGKGTGKGKFDAWGGEYCVGGYKDLAGNFYERLSINGFTFLCMTIVLLSCSEPP